MNGNTSRNSGLWAAGILLLVVVAGPTHADQCGPSDRVALDDAECLAGGFTNRTWPSNDSAWVRNDCSQYGTVVAKVDRAGAPDWTKWLDGSGAEIMQGSQGNIRSISCCRELSDLCSKVNLINAVGCQREYNNSSARAETIVHVNSITGDADAGTCTINAEVRIEESSGHLRTRTIEITVDFNQTKNLKVCDNGSRNDVELINFCT